MTHAANVAPLSYLLSGLSGILNTPGWRLLLALCVHAALLAIVWPLSARGPRRYCKIETNNESFDKGLEKVTVDLNSILTEVFMV